MKKIKLLFLIALVCTLGSCKDYLELKPKDKLSAEVVLSSQDGLDKFLAQIYWRLPLEDFSHAPASKNYNDGNGNNPRVGNFHFNGNHGGWVWAFLSDEAYHSEKDGTTDTWDNNWKQNDRFWVPGYVTINYTNYLLGQIEEGTLDWMTDGNKANLVAECRFLRGYIYSALAQRYGGVPLIDAVQEYDGDPSALRVPRSTEKATWDFALADLQYGVDNLPAANSAPRRANKYIAAAIKSRAALFAASVAKFYDRAPQPGEANSAKLVGGMTVADADNYYNQCIAASNVLISSGEFALYGYDGATTTPVAEATQNLRAMFEDSGANTFADEVIFVSGYGRLVEYYAHNYQMWYIPAQLSKGGTPGRMGPTIELADQYESVGGTPGVPTPILNIDTDADGIGDDYEHSGTGIMEYTNYSDFGFDASTPYAKFANPRKIFDDANKDARFWSTFIVPGDTWWGEEIIIKAGNIKSDGTPQITQAGSDNVEHNGEKYFVFGAENKSDFSGFRIADANYSRSGFLFKKFLKENDADYNGNYHRGTNDWPVIRYAEILLNYAEAALEKSAPDVTEVVNAGTYYNDIRRRAGLSGIAPTTIDNIIRERRVEFAFENIRHWDMIRRRIYHEKYRAYQKPAFKPLQDFRGVAPTAEPNWIFVRTIADGAATYTFEPNFYYLEINGIDANGVVQNY